MKYISEFFRNAALSKLLKPKYYYLSGAVGLIGVFIGITIMVYLGNFLANILSIDIEKPIGETNLAIFIVVGMLIFLFFSLVIGCLLSSSAFSTYMYLTKKINKEEAISYALLSRYPNSWFK